MRHPPPNLHVYVLFVHACKQQQHKINNLDRSELRSQVRTHARTRTQTVKCVCVCVCSLHGERSSVLKDTDLSRHAWKEDRPAKKKNKTIMQLHQSQSLLTPTSCMNGTLMDLHDVVSSWGRRREILFHVFYFFFRGGRFLWVKYLCSQQWPPGRDGELSQTCIRAPPCIPRDALLMEKKARALSNPHCSLPLLTLSAVWAI